MDTPEIARALGRIEGKLDMVGQEQTVIHVKLDRHLTTPHADVKQLAALVRFRWLLLGAAAVISGGVSFALAVFK